MSGGDEEWDRDGLVREGDAHEIGGCGGGPPGPSRGLVLFATGGQDALPTSDGACPLKDHSAGLTVGSRRR